MNNLFLVDGFIEQIIDLVAGPEITNIPILLVSA